MSQNDPQKRYESLSEFEARRGTIEDIFVAVSAGREVPSGAEPVEHPQRTQDAEAARIAAQAEADKNKTWYDYGTSKPDFQEAAQGSSARDDTKGTAQGVDSQQVKETGSRNNMAPPDNAHNVDRAAHQNKMRSDDRRSRKGMTDEGFNKLLDELRADYKDKQQSGQYDQSHDQDRGRDNGLSR